MPTADIETPEAIEVVGGTGIEAPSLVLDGNEYMLIGWSSSAEEYKACTFPYTVLSDTDLYAFVLAKEVADSEYPGLIFSYDAVLGGYVVSGADKTATSVTIPATVKSVPVVAIAEVGFYGYKNLSSVDFSNADNLREIGQYAFSGTSITRADLPDGLEAIGNQAFEFCDDLAYLRIPGSVNSVGSWILQNGYEDPDTYEWIFPDGVSVELVLEDGVTGLSRSSFYGAPVPSVTVPGSVGTIPDYCFCNSGVENIVLEDGISEIGEGAFIYCNNLAEVSLPQSLSSIGEAAFLDCRNLSTVTAVWENVKAIGLEAFLRTQLSGNLNLESLESLGNYAFGSTEVNSVVLGEKITTIPNGVFSMCESLSNVEFKGEITSIEMYAFGYTTSLEVDLSFPHVTSLAASAFNNSGITGIVLGDNLKTINNNTFAYCSNLESVTLPSALERIDNYAFRDCPSLDYIEIPESVVYLGYGTFTVEANPERIIVINSGTLEINVTIFENASSEDYTNTTVYLPDIGSLSEMDAPDSWSGDAVVKYGEDYIS